MTFEDTLSRNRSRRGLSNAFCHCEYCNKAGAWRENIRTRTSAIIDDVIKFDYSPDSYMQALRDNIDLGAIEHLLVTHSHSDHYNAADLEWPQGRDCARPPASDAHLWERYRDASHACRDRPL
nr:hypothetical protein [Paenibacillus ihbetae]